MHFDNFSQEELTQLKSEFEQLSTIEEKFKFWSKELRFGYSRVGVDIALNQVPDFFLIRTKSKDEIEELNTLVLEEAQFWAVAFTKFGKPNRKTFFDYDYEKGELQKKLKDAVNPLPILKQELEWIDNEAKKYKTKPVYDENFFKNFDVWSDSISSFWLNGYEEYYVRRKEPDLARNEFSSKVLLAWMNGYSIAQYRLYIDQLEWEYSQKRTSVAQEETSRKQQLLILYHTGMLDKLSHLAVKDRNKILSVLLNRSEANIRMDLNKIHVRGKTNSIRNKENLEFLFNLLQLTGFEEEAQSVKSELDKLN